MSQDFKKMSDIDLKKGIEDKRKNLLDIRFNMSGTAKRNDKNEAKFKKEIAQMLTEQKERNLKSKIQN